MGALDKPIAKIDNVQRAHRWLAFPFAVFKKFGDDSAGNLAALIAYYGFFSLFPLLLVLTTVLGFILHGHLGAQHAVLHSALTRFPVIGDQMEQHGVGSIAGNGLALGVGIAGTLWAGTGAVKAFENAMDSIWTVPRRKRPNFIFSTLRAFAMLATLGVGTLLAAGLSGVGAGAGAPWWLKATGIGLSFVVNLAVFLVAFRILTVADVSWRGVLPGAIVAAVAWVILQALGGYYVNHQLKNASQVYGLFATVIGLLTWLYLGAQVTLLAAEVNVVRVQRLWPRSLRELTPTDKRALEDQAKEEERKPDERVRADFGGTKRSA
jgi:YihY family inner membrane protein